RIFTKKLIVYAPGYSLKASSRLKKILNTDYTELSRFFIKMRKKYRMDIELTTDMLIPLAFSPQGIMMETFYSNFKHVIWPTAEAGFGRAQKIIEGLNPFVPNEHHVLKVKNKTYKGNIICAGLLMVEDYRMALKKAVKEFDKRKIKIDLIILPQVSFDRYGDDLKGENFSVLSKELNIPVWVRN
ncbi:MAG: hypothetical protein PHW46_05790, partial [Candidatus Omnitrophica bacterium]|nr:hypothetical protein [Candidatus Omnitrophota bacterium]